MEVSYAGFLNSFVIPTAATVVMALIGRAAQKAVGYLDAHTKLANKQTDDTLRNAIQSAAYNGANYVINKAKMNAPNEVVTVNSQHIADAVNYVMRAVPEALDHFGMTPQRVADLVVSYLPKGEVK
jgi:hypothetical protein